MAKIPLLVWNGPPTTILSPEQGRRNAAQYPANWFKPVNASVANEERLRFLRAQLRKGRLSTILSGPQTSDGGGLQLGKKSLLGG